MATLPEPISHDNIDPDALKVVHRLSRHRHQAYLVGGCVRDLLLGREPKDFDVATSATPEEIRGLFRNSRTIGRRFRLVHIFFGRKIIETSTFRQNPRPDAAEDGTEPAELLIRRDNVFGTAEDDARRRDFTINGLFYDPTERKVIDFVDGRADLERRAVRTIGDPMIRFQEDPIRILRAIKFAARLDLTIEPETLRGVEEHREKIQQCAPARVLEEIYRLFREGSAARATELLEETGVLEVILPELAPIMADENGRRELLRSRLEALDDIAAEASLTNAVILGALFSGTVLPADDPESDGGTSDAGSLDEALSELMPAWSISRRDRDRTRQILMAQRRLRPGRYRGRRRRRPTALVRQDYFAESLQFYKLRCLTGEEDPSTLSKWESLRQETNANARPGSSGRRRRRRRRRSGGASSSSSSQE